MIIKISFSKNKNNKNEEELDRDNIKEIENFPSMIFHNFFNRKIKKNRQLNVFLGHNLENSI
ncbi:hypothetical protein BpHYR1_053168 [Brachionus plicatilis]|uniref:Uncharacterized protein n=1 Tax=Brachionus plicatilis TaxID=10195 RepID=A0A3M7QMV6_BRAPC|nr:hypothetical protein BpHYR1_053168 [Brachionus plicatilis]